jgi:acyl-CoA thioester hydrolase
MSIDGKAVCHPWMCDVMGHMTTRHYMAVFDDASYHFLSRTFSWSGSDAAEKNLGWVDVKHTLEYLDEVRSGQLLEVSGELIKIGKKSIVVRYQMREVSSQNVVATLDGVSVLFNTQNREAIVIPDEMRP